MQMESRHTLDGLHYMVSSEVPESKVKERVKAVLKKYDAYQFWPVQNGFGATTLDCLGAHKGCAFAIETKRVGAKPTPRQIRSIEIIEASGAEVFVIDGQNGQLERLEEWLRFLSTN